MKAAGFTIIETLIVLAIAGLILLITFEAFPALERTGRNNQRKQDVSTILSAVSRYELNNSGNMPNCGSSYSDCVGAGKALGNLNLDYYNIDDVSKIAIAGTTPGSLPANANNLDEVQVFNYAKCSNQTTATATGAGYNDVVALFTIETGTSSEAQCQQI